jgi:FlaA1/EpsC-like NDP-sugar epimerase
MGISGSPLRVLGLGEKLYEELLLCDSDQPTYHPLIRQVQEHRIKTNELAALLDQLERVWMPGITRKLLRNASAGFRVPRLYESHRLRLK